MPKPAKKPVERPVLYPNLTVEMCFSGEGGVGPLTHLKAKGLLDWETEAEYVARRIKEDPKAKEKQLLADFNKVFVLRDGKGQKVACWNNNRNRPFDEAHARKLAQVQLNRDWVGPTTMPGETVNGEDVLIGRTGEVLSGQHTLCGLVLAYEIWAGERKVQGGDQSIHWKDLWPEETYPDGPVIDKCVKFGVSENPKVVDSIDNVKPRSLADVFFTSPLFRKRPDGKDYTGTERRELTKMLATAVPFLWKRTGGAEDRFLRYLTPAVAVDWCDRHKKLYQCVKHVYVENVDGGQVVAKLGLSPGRCAGIMYLMASSASDGDEYRNMDPPGEGKKTDFSRLSQAEEFWTLIGTAPDFEAVRTALTDLAVPGEHGSRQAEKDVVLAKAWEYFLDGKGEIPPSALELHYENDPKSGLPTLVDWDDFGGLDLGEAPVKKSDGGNEPVVSPEDVAAEKKRVKDEKEAAKRQRAEEQKAKAAAAKNGKKGGKASTKDFEEWTPPAGEEPTYSEDPTVEPVQEDDSTQEPAEGEYEEIEAE